MKEKIDLKEIIIFILFVVCLFLIYIGNSLVMENTKLKGQVDILLNQSYDKSECKAR
jgi:hypothetical protein